MVSRIVEKVAERFVSKKLAAFLATLAVALVAAAKLDPEARDAFLRFAAVFGPSYLGAQGVIDAVQRYGQRTKGGSK